MISPETKQTILTMYEKGCGIRKISRTLQLSKNTVRRVVRGGSRETVSRTSRYEELKPVIAELFKPCRGNVVRIQEIVEGKYGHLIPYSTLTRIVRDLDLRETKPRAGKYTFPPGQDMQHDTTIHTLVIGGKRVKAQCAGLVLAYSRKLFIQYYPAFTRFEAKCFLREAFLFMDGVCPECTIDNTSVIVACGSGPEAEIAPEMEHFGRVFGVRFIPHRVGHADRKARIERNFSYVERNFLAGRTFYDWHDLNGQARKWCTEVANRKVKRSLGMSAEQAFLMEKRHLIPLPSHIPPVYETLYRTVDVEGYVLVNTNRYSVPERLIGKQVEVHKSWDRVHVFFKHKKKADHLRLIEKRETRVTAKGHHSSLHRSKAHKGPSKEEMILRGKDNLLNAYVNELKKRSKGRGLRKMRKLLELKRTYPDQAFKKALQEASHYGLYDLARLEEMILSRVAGEFFKIDDED
jgi:transposase